MYLRTAVAAVAFYDLVTCVARTMEFWKQALYCVHRTFTIHCPVQEQRSQKSAQWAAAGLAAMLLVASPAAMADEKASGLKPKICANNPTAKICLRDSFASAKSQQQAAQN